MGTIKWGSIKIYTLTFLMTFCMFLSSKSQENLNGQTNNNFKNKLTQSLYARLNEIDLGNDNFLQIWIFNVSFSKDSILNFNSKDCPDYLKKAFKDALNSSLNYLDVQFKNNEISFPVVVMNKPDKNKNLKECIELEALNYLFGSSETSFDIKLVMKPIIYIRGYKNSSNKFNNLNH